ncbi:sensor histidine kinase [Desulfitobacterium hafniense]|nr:sensor histidine kinase [Desulfitobacterium hafniense]
MKSISGQLPGGERNISAWELVIKSRADQDAALRALIQLQELENKRISRELHDSVGQALTSLLLRIRAIQNKEEATEVFDQLEELYHLTTETMEEVRRISLNLRPLALENLGLVDAIYWYVENFQKNTGIEVVFRSSASKRTLPKEIELTIYRIVQEALTNVSKHAQAQHVAITIGGSERVLMSIRDDGKGIDRAKKTEGLGLLGMSERVRLLGGTLSIQGGEAEGTSILVEIPLTVTGMEGK